MVMDKRFTFTFISSCGVLFRCSFSPLPTSSPGAEKLCLCRRGTEFLGSSNVVATSTQLQLQLQLRRLTPYYLILFMYVSILVLNK